MNAPPRHRFTDYFDSDMQIGSESSFYRLFGGERRRRRGRDREADPKNQIGRDREAATEGQRQKSKDREAETERQR